MNENFIILIYTSENKKIKNPDVEKEEKREENTSENKKIRNPDVGKQEKREENTSENKK